MLRRAAAAAALAAGAYAAPLLPAPDCWPRAAARAAAPGGGGGGPAAAGGGGGGGGGEGRRLSVVVPVYNEGAAGVRRLVAGLHARAADPGALEIVLVDAGCRDDSFEGGIEALRREAPRASVKIARSASGRGPALRHGAEVATAENLLFVHSDCQLPSGFDRTVGDALADPEVIMTAFAFAVDDALIDETLDERSRIAPRLRRLERMTNLRSHLLWLPYGDQTMGFRRGEYLRLGGFEAIPMMEDFALVSKARRHALLEGSRICILDDVALCSPRRWQRQGVLANSARNWIFVAAYVLGGLSPHEIFRLYYNAPPPSA